MRTTWKFSYAGHLIYHFMNSCCCCFLRQRKSDDSWFFQYRHKLAKFEEARKGFGTEVDMKNIIIRQRVNKFISKLLLARRQRYAVEYFRRYAIEDYEVNKPESMKRGIDLGRILRELRPKSDKTDNRILYELTGIKLS